MMGCSLQHQFQQLRDKQAPETKSPPSLQMGVRSLQLHKGYLKVTVERQK